PGTATKYASSAYAWLRKVMGPAASFEEMSAAAERSRPGARGVLFVPHLGGEGAPHWDPSLRGAFLGLDVAHDTGDLCRAVMEGVAFALKDAMTFVRDAGLPFDELRLLGGGSTSPLWCQTLSNVLETPLIVPRHRSAAWGGAVLCGMATGLFSRDASALREMMTQDAIYEPDASAAGIYDALHRVYREADIVVAPISRRLAMLRERISPFCE
ncbi:MAG: FGGY-family carbohydrate kinase, partial [Casimicrobiaceae bacterium]